MLKHLQSNEDWNQKSIGAKGFTLIELLVVIVILGILAAVVVFAVSGIQDKGQTSACQTEARTIRTAQEAYYAKQGKYDDTANFSELTAAGAKYLSKTPTLVAQDTGASDTTIALKWKDSTCSTASNVGSP